MGPILVSRASGSKINQKMVCNPQNKFLTSVRDGLVRHRLAGWLMYVCVCRFLYRSRVGEAQVGWLAGVCVWLAGVCVCAGFCAGHGSVRHRLAGVCVCRFLCRSRVSAAGVGQGGGCRCWGQGGVPTCRRLYALPVTYSAVSHWGSVAWRTTAAPGSPWHVRQGHRSRVNTGRQHVRGRRRGQLFLHHHQYKLLPSAPPPSSPPPAAHHTQFPDSNQAVTTPPPPPLTSKLKTWMALAPGLMSLSFSSPMMTLKRLVPVRARGSARSLSLTITGMAYCFCRSRSNFTRGRISARLPCAVGERKTEIGLYDRAGLG